ncbi:MAG: hypothetical protein JW915_01405 [Chitinispirillaceae bacterium]|nr:hypothetical protein [Chitinispirillaceae bacterium]
MKNAFMISVYMDPDQFYRLVVSLNENADFYVHCDSKTDQSMFEEKVLQFENVTFVKKRFHVNWGGFAQVQLQKELLKAVIESGQEYLRVICLSGMDYPIWSNREIHKYFVSNENTEFISGMNISRFVTDPEQRKKIVKYHLLRDIKISNAKLKRIFTGSARILMTAIPIRKNDYILINNKRYSVFVGSDYWALTFKCAKYVYKSMCDERKLMNYFKTSFVPSEMCTQTIVFNSEFGKNALEYKSHIYEGIAALTPLHYIDYNGFIKIFDECDYKLLKESGKMFFRKASSKKSQKLISMIDKDRGASV